MKNYESPTIESAGGTGEMGTWFRTETLVLNLAEVVTVIVLVLVFIGLLAFSPPPEEQTK
jgi:hypothetical protein